MTADNIEIYNVFVASRPGLIRPLWAKADRKMKAKKGGIK